MCIGGLSASAQCNPGEVEVRVSVVVDQYGYEGYWELVPTGNTCGTSPIFSGGNTAVGCGGAGAQNQTPGGYANNTTINEGPWCLAENACFDIIYVDDYNDAGFGFQVKVNGFNTDDFQPSGTGVLTSTFCATLPPVFDAGISSVSTPVLYDSQGLKDVKGVLVNEGQTVITSLDINYKVGNSPTETMPLTGLSVANAQSANFTHPTQWNAPLGPHTLKVWTSNVNGGNGDLNGANDTITYLVSIVSGIPNVIESYIGKHPLITEIGNSSDQLDNPTDLDFHPDLTRKELWVVNKRTRAAGGSVTIYSNAGEVGQTDLRKIDGNAWHFMALPTALAFSGNGNFGTSQGVWNANSNASSGGNPFTGPSLWSSDLAVFGENAGPGTNGSHLDMLHETPYGQGIANETANAFWVNDGNSNDLVRYDFAVDHGPGNDYHGDGIVHRYTGVNLLKDPANKVSSHLVVSDGWVYAVDYGNKRVFRLEIGTGTVGGTPSFNQTEPLAEYANVTGFNTEDVVTTGLVEPSGIDIIEDRMIVSDYSNGQIIIYDISTMPATQLHIISTGATGVMGVKIGPDGKIWYVDYDAETVNRIDHGPVGVDESVVVSKLNVYPNPAKNNFVINLSGGIVNSTIVSVYNMIGELIFNEEMNTHHLEVNTERWSNGIYQVRIEGASQINSEKIIVQH